MVSDPNDADLTLLNVWKTAQLDIKRSSNNVYYVAIDSIPTGVIEAIGASLLIAKCIEMDGLQCLTFAYWQALCEELRDQIFKRMQARSLKLAMRRPSPDDLDHAPTLSNWIAIRDIQFGGAVLVGTPGGHPTLQCALIKTSRLCGIATDQTYARTTSRWYRLKPQAQSSDLYEQFGMWGEQMVLEPLQIKAIIAEDREEEGLR